MSHVYVSVSGTTGAIGDTVEESLSKLNGGATHKEYYVYKVLRIADPQVVEGDIKYTVPHGMTAGQVMPTLVRVNIPRKPRKKL